MGIFSLQLNLIIYTMYTKDQFVKHYSQLEHHDHTKKNEANQFIIQASKSDNAWTIARELIAENIELYKFLGSQLLYQKTKDTFASLNQQHQQELKDYCFNLLYADDPKSSPVINKLSSTCAVIACYMVSNKWSNFFNDLVEVMKKKYEYFVLSINVLGEIPDECKSMKDKKFYQKSNLKQIFLKNSEILSQIFSSGFENKNQKQILRLLRCLKNWTIFGYRVIQNPNIISLIISTADTQQKQILAQQIFSTALKNTHFNFHINSDHIIRGKSKLSPDCITSLQYITRYVLSPKHHMWYSYLVRSLISYYPWILLQSPIICQSILNSMSQILGSKERDVSYSGVLFWTDLFLISYQHMPQQQIGNKLFQSIFPHVEKVFSTIAQKLKSQDCINISDQQNIGSQSEHDIDLDEETEYIVDVTFQEYREQCSKLLQYFYLFLAPLPENYILKYVITLLTSKTEQDMYLAIYILRSIMEALKPSSQLEKIIQHITHTQSNNEKIKIQSFRLLMSLNKQMLNPTETLEYISHYFNHKELHQYAINTFYVLSSKIDFHNDDKLLTKVTQLLNGKILNLNNQISIETSVNASLKIVLKTSSEPLLQNCLKSIYQNSILYLQSVVTERKTSINSLVEVFSIVQSFQQLKKLNPSIFYKFSVQYCNTLIPILVRVLNLSKENNQKYQSNNQLYFVEKIYCRCLDMVGPNSIVSIQLINLVCQFLGKSPVENFGLLNIITQTVFAFIGVYNNLHLWLQQSYLNLSNFLVSSIQASQDPDLIRVFFKFQNNILKYDSRFLQPSTIQLSLYCFQNIVQCCMQKAILEYFQTYLSVSEDQQSKILQLSFSQYSISYQISSSILVKILCSKDQQVVRQVIQQLLRLKYAGCYEQPQIQLLIRAFTLYIRTRDFKNLRQIMLDLDLEGKIGRIQERYELQRTKNKNK